MAGNRNSPDDRVLRRLRYAAAIVAMAGLGLLVLVYAFAYATREVPPPAPDGPLVVVIVTAMLVLLGLVTPAVLTSLLPSRPQDPPKKDPKETDD